MRLLAKLLLCITVLFTTTSQAVLSLELTQGVQGAIPIAIVPFAGQDVADNSPDNIANVVNTDLQNSGRFKVMDKGAMSQTPSEASQVDFSYWQKQNMNNLVIGTVQAAGNGKYRVQFHLLNAFANKGEKTAAPAWQNAVLLSNTFTVDQSQLRALGHHISDLIYQNLTGDKGVFSTRIAYVVAQRSPAGSQYTLEVADMDGFNPKPLLRSAEPIMSPSWSPDGRRVAYVSFEGGSPVVYVQDVTSGSRQLLSKFPGLNSAPAWSPDGRQLALVLTRTGYPKIFVMAAGSHQLTQVTQGDSIDTEPAWAPDGKSILFTSSRGGSPQVYRAFIGSGNAQRVTFEGNYNASPSVSPDGTVLAVLSGGGNAYNIAIQDLASGRYSQLTHDGNDQSPSLAPNGKMVLYATQSGGRGVLGMASIDGRVTIVLPAREGDVREPAWGPLVR